MKRICDDCSYEGEGYSRTEDICGSCKQNTHFGGEDVCEHCGDTDCLMMACPECGGELLEPDEIECLDEDADAVPT